MKIARRLLFAVVGAGLLAGCGPSLELFAVAPRDQWGDLITLRLVNHAMETFETGNFCHTVIETHTADGWAPLEEPLRACTKEAIVLRPFSHVEGTRRLHAALNDGNVRFSVSVDTPSGIELVTSPAYSR